MSVSRRCAYGTMLALVAAMLSLPLMAHAAADDLKPRLAACISCHGEQGSGGADNARIPRLAGKPAGYLLQQLEFYQTGRRQHPVMQHMVRYLDRAYLEEMADYFAAQDAPYHQHDAPQVAADVMARGKQLVLEGDASIGVDACNSCHGERMTGVEPLIPGLMGLSYDYIVAQLHLWRAHDRDAGGTFCMGVVANRMQESDLVAASAYLAGMDLPQNMEPMAADEQTEPLPGWCVVGDQAGRQP